MGGIKDVQRLIMIISEEEHTKEHFKGGEMNQWANHELPFANLALIDDGVFSEK